MARKGDRLPINIEGKVSTVTIERVIDGRCFARLESGLEVVIDEVNWEMVKNRQNQEGSEGRR
jgi:hypothetical protein